MVNVSAIAKNHGVEFYIDEQNSRVRCNYCKKEMTDFSQLECHLAGENGDVLPCAIVPNDVKETMIKRIAEKTLENPSEPKRKRITSVDIKSETNIRNSDTAQRGIASFFSEMGIEFTTAKCASFMKMASAIVAQPHILRELPSYENLRDRIIPQELEAMKHLVREIRDSWPETGCSILLDGWATENGEHRMNILVDCPKGPIYLRSCDVSDCLGDSPRMQLFLDQVIKEVGQSNVVQIIMDNMEPSFLRNVEMLSEHQSIYWNLSSSYCLELILKDIEQIQFVEQTLEEAKRITRFFYSEVPIFQLMKARLSCPDLVSTSKFKSARPFLTLQIMLSQKGNLKRMLETPEWDSFAPTYQKKVVRLLFIDEDFWDGLEKVVNIAKPIVEVFTCADKPQIGCIYELMDNMKERIQDAYVINEDEHEDAFKQYWDVIDNVWDKYLHSPLHAAAFHLNPYLHSSVEIDDEVESGLLDCLARLEQDPHIRGSIYQQIERYYRGSSNALKVQKLIADCAHVSPAEWWSSLGEPCPELKKFARRILSQTCDGAARYRLKKNVAEKLLQNRCKNVVQEQLRDEAFLHYNLQLQSFNANGDGRVSESGELDPMDDWIRDDEIHY